MPHLAQHFDELFPRLGFEFSAEVIPILSAQPINSSRGIRWSFHNSIISESVKINPLHSPPAFEVVAKRICLNTLKGQPPKHSFDAAKIQLTTYRSTTQVN